MKHNEQQMREQKAACPKTVKELNKEINSLVEGEHDYGTCVYAMSLAACAVLNYVSRKLGVTGFQTSCADMDILKRNRNMNGDFIILKAEDLLYPQYDLRAKLEDWIVKQKSWLKEQALKNLKESKACDSVQEHWKKLAK